MQEPRPAQAAGRKLLNMDSEFTPIFICGHRKSATSMLLNVFDHHPELHVYPTDLKVLYAYFPEFIRQNQDRNSRVDRLNKVVFDDPRYYELVAGGVDIEAFRNRFWEIAIGALDIEEVLRSLLRAYQTLNTDTDSQLILSKETSIEIYAQEIADWFPDAKFIHILRDPRDNYAALRAGVPSYYSHLGENASRTLASLIHRALLGFEFAAINQTMFGESRYRVVRFEDLTTDPERVLSELCDFMGIAFDLLDSRPTILGQSTGGNSFEQKDLREISTVNVNRWKERISKKEAQVIEFYFHKVMQEHGYALEYRREQAARAVSEFYKWSNYEYFYSDRFSTEPR